MAVKDGDSSGVAESEQRVNSAVGEEGESIGRRSCEHRLDPGDTKRNTSGGEAAAFNLSKELIGGSCEGKYVESAKPPVLQHKTLECRARRCKSPYCPTCASTLAYKDAERVKVVIDQWKKPLFWTLTVNPQAYPDQREILEHIKAKRCVSEWVRAIDRRGLLAGPEWFGVMEFQDGSRSGAAGTQQVHFHILLDTKVGYIDHPIAWEIWERQAAPFRRTGHFMDKHNPQMGFCWVERVKKVIPVEHMARYLSKGVAGYLSKGVKTLPEWYRKYLDDGKYLKLKLHSPRFFSAVAKPEPKYRRAAVTTKRKRRTVSQRIEACKHDADVFIKIDDKLQFVDRCCWDFETVLAMLQRSMSEDDEKECRRVGRVGITAGELIKVAGVDAFRRLLQRNEGQSIGRDDFDEMQIEFVERVREDDKRGRGRAAAAADNGSN